MKTFPIKVKLTLITLVFLIGTSGINAQAGLLDSLLSGKLNKPTSTNVNTAGVQVQTINSTYTLPDATTKRLSILIWYPITSEGSLKLQGAPYPLIVFSHGGITGAADHCAGITENLAKQGYIVAATTHEDSIYYQGKKSSSPLAAGFWDRPLDVKGIITILLGLNNDPKSIFYRTIDEEAIGVFGHSLGGWTSEILCGAVPPGREDYTDERVKAAMFLAPGNMLFNKNNIGNVQVPSFTIFGGKDTIVRTEANKFVYEQAAVPKYFGVITNFSHLDFANYGKSKPETKVLVQYTLAFFDRYLKDDYNAEETLKTSSPVFSAYEYALEQQGESNNPQDTTVPIVIRAEENSDEDAQTEDATASGTPTTAANLLGSLFSGGTGGIGNLLGGGLTGSGNSGMPMWVGWNGKTFGIHLGQRPSDGTNSQSNLSSGLIGGTEGLGNLLGGLTGSGGTGGIGNLLGGLTDSNSGTGLSDNWQEVPAYGTELETIAAAQETTSSDNTTDNDADAPSSDISSELTNSINTTEEETKTTPENNDNQTAMVDPKTIRLPLVQVHGDTPAKYGGLTQGTPGVIDAIVRGMGNNNTTSISINDIAAYQFLGIEDPHFTDTQGFSGFLPSDKGHLQTDKQNNICAIYYVAPELPSLHRSLMAVNPGGSITRTMGNIITYIYYEPHKLYLQIDFYPGIMGNLLSAGFTLGGFSSISEGNK
ncbi:MAG: hypothetical protein V1662_06195 [Candidatus Omnitrophota bacterium]